MPADRSALEVQEYTELRRTIRQRGTVRVIVTLITFVAWAMLVLAVMALLVVPAFSLVPLLVLAAGFEIVFATHVGVERIGRYLQVRYEATADGPPMWEHVAMRIGLHPGGSGGIDPLYSGLFVGAAVLNLAPVGLLTAGSESPMIGPVPVELLVYGLFHAVFVGRVASARRFAARQRDRDLAMFTQQLGSHRE